ncbi:MAG TPA: site-specific integrase, partial [Bacteroidia bacterium]|nr:site-specific integrase [Bacteroidia bacterium]
MSKVAYINGFSAYIKLEKSLSANSNEAYMHDVELLYEFLQEKHPEKNAEKLTLDLLQQFIQWINERNLSARSQARIISGIKAFYKYLLLENIIADDPTTLLETPKLGRKLPEFLTIEEIDTMLNAIDLSTAEGQ